MPLCSEMVCVSKIPNLQQTFHHDKDSELKTNSNKACVLVQWAVKVHLSWLVVIKVSSCVIDCQ